LPVLILAALFLFRDFSRPFFGLHENNSIMFSLYAKNILEEGLLNTKFCGTSYVGHPCLLQVLLAMFYEIGGFRESSGRLLPILASLGSVFLVYLLAKKLFNKVVGLMAAAIMIFIPSFLTFGDMICHEMVLMFFGLLGMLFFLKWHQERRQVNLYLSLLSFGLASFIDWPGIYLLIIFSVFLFFQKNKRPLLIFATISILIILSLFLHLIWVAGSLETIFATYQRLFLNRGLSIEGGIPALIAKVYFREKLLFTPEIILLSFFGFIIYLVRKERQAFFLLTLLLFPLVHVLLFRGGWFQHFYWSYYFIPFLALSSAYCLFFLVSRFWLAKRRFLAIFLVFLFFLLYLRISLRNLSYFDSLYDKNLYYGILEVERLIGKEKVFLLTPGYSTLPAQFYLPGGVEDLKDKSQVDNSKIKWAFAWILPDTTAEEKALIDDLSKAYPSRDIIGEGNYPVFKLIKMVK
jgi:4-amino-4-deoxy-L-arabinose transferase-like glycosyltransferase